MTKHLADAIGITFAVLGAAGGAFGVLGCSTATSGGVGSADVAPATGSAAAPATTAAQIDPQVTAPAERLGEAYERIAAHVMPTVVSVYSEKVVRFSAPEDPFSDDDLLRRFFGESSSHGPTAKDGRRELRARIRGMGSGMLLDHRGHVLTNYHVISGVSAIKVAFADGRTLDAKVTGTDPMTDVAVLELAGTIPSTLPTVVLGDSDALKVGDLVLAIGAPFGLTQTVTNGIISAKGRSDVGIATYEDFLQTDAPVNPGNSGGPLVNMRGEVIGMNSAIASGVGQSAGVSFAIPSNMIKALLAKLSAGQEIVRGTLGVGIQEMTADLASQFGLSEPKGVLISQVSKDSPASRAGLERGDVILSYAGNKLHDSRQLRDLVAATIPGTSVVLEILRSGHPIMIVAQIGKQAQPKRGETMPIDDGAKPEQLGLSVLTLTPELASQLGVSVAKGVIITDVDEDGVGAEAGLEPRDVILEADRKPVAGVDELAHILAKVKDKHSVLLLLRREHTNLYLVLHW